MIELGKIQQLKIAQESDYGFYLTDEEESTLVLLPNKFVTADMNLDDEIEVFIFKDSEDRLTATTQTPDLVLGEINYLNVVDITEIGAFLDWGLDKDLFLPFKEQKDPVEIGQSYVVGLYLDKSNRLCATTRVYDLLSTNHSFEVNQKVSCIVYQNNHSLGALVAVENKFHGLIPARELTQRLEIGQTIECRISSIREDNKLILSLKEKINEQIFIDSEIIYKKLESNNGFLPFNDKSSPDSIKSEFKMTKNAFKRAVGKLLKDKKIEFKDFGISKK